MNNILIAVCCGDGIVPDTVTSIFGAMETLRAHNVGYMLSIIQGGYKPLNMNTQVRKAYEMGATHLMSIDCDMTFPSSGIQRLLDADKDIIGANYNVRGHPGSYTPESTVKLADKDGNLITTDSIPSSLFKCWSLGLGFVLMKMDVFEHLDKPYFRDAESPEGEHHTEDVEFFSKCQRAGYDVWCNPTIKVGHIGRYTY